MIPYKKYRNHQIIQMIIIAVIFIGLGIGSASLWDHFQISNQQNTTAQSGQSSQSSPKQSLGQKIKSKFTAEPQNKPGYTLSVFPKNIRGTWYSYDTESDVHKLQIVTITARTITEDGHTLTLHARSKHSHKDYFKGPMHKTWIIALRAPRFFRGTRFTQILGWNQGAGDGESYEFMNENGMPVLQSVHGAGCSLDGNFYKSKSLAKQHKNKIYHSEKTDKMIDKDND